LRGCTNCTTYQIIHSNDKTKIVDRIMLRTNHKCISCLCVLSGVSVAISRQSGASKVQEDEKLRRRRDVESYPHICNSRTEHSCIIQRGWCVQGPCAGNRHLYATLCGSAQKSARAGAHLARCLAIAPSVLGRPQMFLVAMKSQSLDIMESTQPC
jgi:hypothetical protein